MLVGRDLLFTSLGRNLQSYNIGLSAGNLNRWFWNLWVAHSSELENELSYISHLFKCLGWMKLGVVE